MSQCCQSPRVRIEIIRNNLRKEQMEMIADAILPKDEMTDVLQNTSDTLNPVDGTDAILIEIGMDQGDKVNQEVPTFRVPANALLPSEYKEVINYNNVQYVNGFFRTQIGRYVKVECLVGSDQIMVKHGYLIGVGLDYILLQEPSVRGNILSIDFWSVKFMYIYYNKEDLMKAMPFIEEK